MIHTNSVWSAISKKMDEIYNGVYFGPYPDVEEFSENELFMSDLQTIIEIETLRALKKLIELNEKNKN